MPKDENEWSLTVKETEIRCQEQFFDDKERLDEKDCGVSVTGGL